MARAESNPDSDPIIRLGVSTCLLGERVRYDGGHKLDHFLVDVLGKFVEWVPVCPEVEMGLPIPREAVRLVGHPDHPRLVALKSGAGRTAIMVAWAQRRLDELEAIGLHGFVFKGANPCRSCSSTTCGAIPCRSGCTSRCT